MYRLTIETVANGSIVTSLTKFAQSLGGKITRETISDNGNPLLLIDFNHGEVAQRSANLIAKQTGVIHIKGESISNEIKL